MPFLGLFNYMQLIIFALCVANYHLLMLRSISPKRLHCETIWLHFKANNVFKVYNQKIWSNLDQRKYFLGQKCSLRIKVSQRRCIVWNVLFFLSTILNVGRHGICCWFLFRIKIHSHRWVLYKYIKCIMKMKNMLKMLKCFWNE